MLFYLNCIFFAFFLFLCICAVLNKEHVNKSSSEFKFDKLLFENDRLHMVAVILLAAVAVFVRVYRFGSFPVGFNQDEAMAAVDAYALASYGTDRFGMAYPVYFTAWGFAQMNVLESYLMIPFIKILGLNEISARLPMLLVNLASIYVFCAFFLQVWGRKAALIALFVLAINPWHIMLSRWGLESNLYPAFLLFAMFFIYKGAGRAKSEHRDLALLAHATGASSLKRRASFFLYISMLFFGLSMYAYGISYFATPLLLLALACYLFSKKLVSIRTILICAGVYMFFAWPIFGVMAVNHFKLESIITIFFTIPYFPDAVRTNDLLPYSDNILRQAANNLYSLLDVVLFQFPDTPWNAIPAFGPLYLFSMPLIFLGARRLVKNISEPGCMGKQSQIQGFGFDTTSSGSFMILCWLIVGILTGIMVNGVNINRVNIIFFPLIALCVLGLHELISIKRSYAAYVLAATVYAISFTLFLQSYFWTDNERMANSFYDGFGQAVAYAEEQDAPVLYITTNTQYQGAYAVSEILTMFHAKTDALYYQGKADGYGPNGLYKLPYSQRYRYMNFLEADEEIFEDMDGLYIFNTMEAFLFPEHRFEVVSYGEYCVGRINTKTTHCD